jgi:hypothetical protein
MLKQYKTDGPRILVVLLWLACQAFTTATYAQSATVSGVVKNSRGESIPGVNVLERGTVNGTATDGNGLFKITAASSESVLVFSFVGMVTQEVKVGNRSEISVELLDDTKSLSELVVVGYGTQEKKDVTGSMASIKNEDFNKGVISSPQQLLQGKVAGVNITAANGEPGGSRGKYPAGEYASVCSGRSSARQFRHRSVEPAELFEPR